MSEGCFVLSNQLLECFNSALNSWGVFFVYLLFRLSKLCLFLHTSIIANEISNRVVLSQ